MAEKKLQPIIIKRVKKSAHAPHGGAWKIAYADFVTAMMAFFLLMWLLGSTAKGELQGIAAYFSSPLKVSMAGGDGAGNSSSVIPGGGNDLAKVHGQVRRSESADNSNRRTSIDAGRSDQAQVDSNRIKALKAKVDAMITSNARLNEFRSQIRTDVTPDGLQIQIVDEQNRPMFDSGSAVVKPYMRDILREVGAALAGAENRISLSGHTDAAPYGNADRGYSNWELSADRANASRRELVAAGMPLNQLARITGLASSDLLLPDDPRAPQNRRITITVLTQEAEKRLLGHRGPVTRNALPPSLAGDSGSTPAQAATGDAMAEPATQAPATPAASPARVTN
ncbi:Chemotaxis protein MotB [Delftia tsuruhatensis]|uniref:flagellar motor protein MotB n=1 Tax=Delftia tsuruhatensis TaxID=180282 RepID=UPI001E6D9D0E|nr:flagellar motor protein MotB [Delftia tsuruhatensis]CAB5698946.1 Chemotaxis protein MotB [Delftia tsuruhatensis]CAC9676504.1 Chemotaxis protein MotB [Delftia tsuruhatensis]